MKNLGLNQLREMFLSFFETKGHLRLPSFSLIPERDASLLLINSGMAPMKPWFTGEEEPPRKRACTCQKCIRTGDIDNIGYTARHATFFEMLGNFSFGDYFKKEAIAWCWEFLSSPEWMDMDPNRLFPSVYLDDDEAVAIWRDDIGISEDRIFRFGKEDNFWEHGAGPCGPCSEVYYDRGEKYGCGKPGCTVGCDCDRYIEVWNNVFTQFNGDGAGNYVELSRKNIDTGMGLERLACVSQEVESIFAVDTMMSITNKVSELTGAIYNQSRDTDVSLRVITDHIRSATFMICDGVLPQNEGRGYVLRRLLRRAARHGKMLGVKGLFLCEICGTVIEENAVAYPELVLKRDFITRAIRTEEENFARTIDGGMKILSELVSDYERRNQKIFSGADAFKLYDTYGFPIDLSIEILAEQGMTVDRDEFTALMKEQRDRARQARESLGDLAWTCEESGFDSLPTEFVGYDNIKCETKILDIVVEGEPRLSISEGEKGTIVLEKTPFYAEAGGQTADRGEIYLNNAIFTVLDVKKLKSGKYLHHGFAGEGVMTVDDPVVAEVIEPRRTAIMRAHSATHLLHRVLKNVLGGHVEQAGSLVTPDSIRFDFSHFAPISPEELTEIDERVNDAIFAGMPVTVREMSQSEAKALGATALFGEKYGDIVRVVKMGDFSMELCGGTHIDNTAKIGGYRTLSEFSVASGVRRIEAFVGREILSRLSWHMSFVDKTALLLKTAPAEVPSRLDMLVAEQRENRRIIEKLRSDKLRRESDELMRSGVIIDGIRLVSARVDEDITNDEFRVMGDYMRDKDDNIAAMLSRVSDGKISFFAACGKTAVSRGIKAGELIKHVCAITGGSGGGKPESAMGGGKDEAKLHEALNSVSEFIADKLRK